MTTLMTMILAALPNILIGIGAKLFTEKFLQSVIEKTLIFSLEKLVKLSTNTIDDEIVGEIKARLNGEDSPMKKGVSDLIESERLLDMARQQNDFKEYARLLNERNSRK